MSSQPPIFVVGTPRSGTTLLARILGRHPSLFMPGETHFFPDIYSRRRQYGDPPTAEGAVAIYRRLLDLYKRYNEPADHERISRLFASPEPQQELAEACRMGYREGLDCFMKYQVLDARRLRWGNNAPRDLFHVEDILDFYPDARILCCVRDVRDFLASYRGKWRATTPEHIERLKQLYHPVVTSLLWKVSMKRAEKLRGRLPDWQFAVVRYEDLVLEPRATVTKLCQVASVDFQEQMLEVATHNSSEVRDVVGIFTQSVGGWQEKLVAEEVAVGQQMAGRHLALLGYKRVALNPSALRMGMLYAGAPYHAWKALRANSTITGPLAPYLAKRVAALWR